jgi:hypothetical protein
VLLSVCIYLGKNHMHTMHRSTVASSSSQCLSYRRVGQLHGDWGSAQVIAQVTPAKRHRCLEPLAAAAAAGAADLEPSLAAAPAGQQPVLRLTKRQRKLSWPKWERKLFEQLLQANQEQVRRIHCPAMPRPAGVQPQRSWAVLNPELGLAAPPPATAAVLTAAAIYALNKYHCFSAAGSVGWRWR